MRDHRRAAGLTQEDLAERAGVSPRSISEIERGGAHTPRRDTVALLARALGLVGPDRQAFEEHVKRTRPLRVKSLPDQTTIKQKPVLARRVPELPKHNLWRSLTSLVGREQELTELAQMLPTTPLLTLVGVGGVGKTSLALEFVRQNLAKYPDGCWLVELAGLADPSLVPGAVATAVGLRDVHASNVTSLLSEYIGPRHLLLVLDNCEHLVGACAELAIELLRTCPRLQILTTSREPLAIDGEITLRVPPLGLPDLRRPQSPEQIIQSGAARLFIERARAVGNTLVLTDANVPAIARICIGVDGIPLALELAAAQARVLTVEELAVRLEGDSAVLGRAIRTALPRHQTISATLNWSHDLLGQHEQILLRRLAVFAGGWNLHLAEEVCSGEGVKPDAVLDLLTLLLDKSMVQVNASNAVTRYRLLEPIRQYALERLEVSGEATTYRARHASALLELAQIGPDDPAGPDEIPSLDRLEVDHDNLCSALSWAMTHSDSHTVLCASAALFRFWERRGHIQEGCAWLERALASAAGGAPASDRAQALNALSNLYWRGGDPERARLVADKSLAVSRGAGNTRGMAWALLNLGMAAHLLHEHQLAVQVLEQSVPLARQSGHVPLLSLALTYLGQALLKIHGPLARSPAAVLEESLALAEAAHSRYATGQALATLGDLVWAQGYANRALPLWRRSLLVASELVDLRGIAGCLERLALVLAASNRLEAAPWLFGAAEAQRTVLRIRLHDDEQSDHAYFVALVRQELGDAFATAWSDGQASTVDEAVIRALETTVRLSGVSKAGRARDATRRHGNRLHLLRAAESARAGVDEAPSTISCVTRQMQLMKH